MPSKIISCVGEDRVRAFGDVICFEDMAIVLMHEQCVLYHAKKHKDLSALGALSKIWIRKEGTRVWRLCFTGLDCNDKTCVTPPEVSCLTMIQSSVVSSHGSTQGRSHESFVPRQLRLKQDYKHPFDWSEQQESLIRLFCGCKWSRFFITWRPAIARGDCVQEMILKKGVFNFLSMLLFDDHRQT